ncbi:hypothetical protein HispidOSU_008201 [Sigmodon hispidus]
MRRIQSGQMDSTVLPRAGSRAALSMTPTRALRKPADCVEMGAGGPCLDELGPFVAPKGAGSGKLEAASLESLATQAHISSVRVAPKQDGGGEVMDSSPLC